MDFNKEIKIRTDEINEISNRIQHELDRKKLLNSQIKQIKHERKLHEINSKIRVVSKCYVPQVTGGGWKFTVTDLEITDGNFGGCNYKYVINLKGVLNNGDIFDYECPYDGGSFEYYNYDEMYPEHREIIIKKY